MLNCSKVILIFLVLICSSSNFYGQSATNVSNRIISVIQKKEKGCEIQSDKIDSYGENINPPDAEFLIQKLNCDNQSFIILVSIFSSENAAIDSYNSSKKTGITGWGAPPKILEENIKGLPKESFLAKEPVGIFYNLSFRIFAIHILVSAPNEMIAKQFSKYAYEATKIQ